MTRNGMTSWIRDNLRRVFGVTDLTGKLDAVTAQELVRLEDQRKDHKTQTATLDEINRQVGLLIRGLNSVASAMPGSNHLPEIEAELATLRQTAQNTGHSAVRDLIKRSSASSFFDCTLNDVQALIPRDTLRTLLHCVFAIPGAPLLVNVETEHLNWLREKLQDGEMFLDVGAATGAMTIPIAGGRPGVRVLAFEPARTARRLLAETIEKNNLKNAEVVGVAVADQPGQAEFSEMKYDESTGCNFLPETSTISTKHVHPDLVAERYTVEIITLDALLLNRPEITKTRSVKIDVEGFEVKVLDGAGSFISRVQPRIAIDIHQDPFGPDTTDAQCRQRLERFGYTFARVGHVLLCTPPVAQAVTSAQTRRSVQPASLGANAGEQRG
jgi:FkbM family methyltransferase